MEFHSIVVALALWLELLSSTWFANGLSIPINGRIKIRPAPLIGGPSWLPVHCQVIVDNKNVFDFVPLNATEPSTLQKLVTLEPVPAMARTRIQGVRSDSSSYVDKAAQFCENYDKELHLVTNNCWTFAFELIHCITKGDDSEKRA